MPPATRAVPAPLFSPLLLLLLLLPIAVRVSQAVEYGGSSASLDEPHVPGTRQHDADQLTVRAAEDIRFAARVDTFCAADVTKLCSDVPSEGGRVFECLSSHVWEHGTLQDTCAAAVFDQMERFSADVDFNIPLRKACDRDLERHCQGIKPALGLRLECLQRQIFVPGSLGADCLKEVEKDLYRKARDYRLHAGLQHSCFGYIAPFCAHSCNHQMERGMLHCDGWVLRCLQNNQRRIDSSECKAAISHWTRLMLRNPVRLDIPFKTACAKDLDCPEGGPPTMCIKETQKNVSKECAVEYNRIISMQDTMERESLK